MEKLFSKEDLAKIKTGDFDYKSLRKNGEEFTAFSIDTRYIGDVLSAFVIKYKVNGNEIKDIFISNGAKACADSIANCTNKLRGYLSRKNNITIDTRNTGYEITNILSNDYLTDEGTLYKAIDSSKFIPISMSSLVTHKAVITLRDFVREGRFHVTDIIDTFLIQELSLVEYETKNDWIIDIRCEKCEYLKNILLICSAIELLDKEIEK